MSIQNVTTRQINRLIVVIIVLLPCSLLGNPPRSLEDTQFIVEKKRTNLLPEAARLFRQAPAVAAMPPTKPLRYQFHTPAYAFDPLKRKIKVLRAKQDVFRQLYDNYVRVGYGNYFTSAVEAFWTMQRTTNLDYSLYGKYMDAGYDKYFRKYDGVVQLRAEKFMKLFSQPLQLQGTLKYNGTSYRLQHLPASTIVADQPLVPVHQLWLRGRLKNYVNQSYSYHIDTELRYLRDVHQAHERGVDLRGIGNYVLNDDFTLHIAASYHYNYHPTAQTSAYYMGDIQPSLSFTLNNFDVRGGLNVVAQNDPLNSVDGHLRAYPILNMQYAQYSWGKPYLDIQGGTKPQTLTQLRQENPLIAIDTQLRPTHQPFALAGGVHGDVMEQISYQASLSRSSYTHYHCWINNIRDPRLYQIVHDPAATVYRLSGAITLINCQETLTTRLQGSYFRYFLKKLQEAWHRPRYQVDMLSTYRLYDKMLFTSTFSWLGGRKAANQHLTDVIDLGVGVDYAWSSRMSIFINCQNLLNRTNPFYLHYPTRGIHLMAGLAYAW